MNCPNCGNKMQSRGEKDEKLIFFCPNCEHWEYVNKKENTLYKEDGKFLKISCVSKTIKDIDALISHFNIDTTKWEIKSFEVKTTGDVLENIPDVEGDDAFDEESKQIYTAFSVKATFEKKFDEIKYKSAIETLKNDAKNYSPKYERINYTKPKNGMLYEIDIPDVHFGRLTWEDESGIDYDIKIAERMFSNTVQKLAEHADKFPIERILFPIGNDFFNVNSQTNTTLAGTPQQEDTRWQKTFKKGREILVGAIDMLSQIAPVDVLIVPGNHDTERTFYLGDSLESWYHNCPNVEVDNSPNTRKYYFYGKSLIGFTHGYHEKLQKLPLLMALEVPELWAKASIREWHTGDKHHKKDIVFKTDESTGVVVRILRALASSDAWTYNKGFVGALKAGEAFLWDKQTGLIAQFTAMPEV